MPRQWGWSNLVKIGARSGVPSEDLVRAQRDLCVRAFREELEHLRKGVVLVLTNKTHEILERAVADRQKLQESGRLAVCVADSWIGLDSGRLWILPEFPLSSSVWIPAPSGSPRLLGDLGLAGQLCIGVTKDPGTALEAHAWVLHEGVPVLDEPELARYSLLSVFSSDA